MATFAENLETTRTNAAATLAEITANPKPTYSVNGRSFSWVEYQRYLMDLIDWADKKIALEDETSGEERITEGFT